MNFLAHLWLADAAGAEPCGAVLGDVLRGPVDARFPPDVARSIRLHRRIDAVTDRHPQTLAAISRFEPGARRYAGVLLDMIYDHALALRWTDFSSEPLLLFARRSACALAEGGRWFEAAGGTSPNAWMFRRLLLSYRSEDGMDRAIRRTAQRLRNPQGLVDAARGWPAQVPAACTDLDELLPALLEAARTFMRDAAAAITPAA